MQDLISIFSDIASPKIQLPYHFGFPCDITSNICFDPILNFWAIGCEDGSVI